MSYNYCILSLFFTGFLMSCGKTPFSKAIHAQDEIVRTVAIAPSQIERILKEEKIEAGPGINKVVQEIETVIKTNIDSVFFNRPDMKSSVFPGSLIWFDALNDGQFNILSYGSEKLPYKVSILSAKASAAGVPVTFFEVDGTLSRFQSELRKLTLDSHALDFQYQVVSANSFEEAATKFGMSAKFLNFGKGSGKFDTSKQKHQSSVVIALKQIFFTVSTDVASLPDKGGILALRHGDEETDKRLADEILKRKSEVVYISDVSYGRVVFLLVRSESSQADLEAAAKASGGLFGFSAGAGIQKSAQQIMSSSQVQCVMSGSSSESDSVGAIFNGSFEETTQAVKKYLSDTMKITNPMDAVPLIFSTRFTRDNSTASISDTSKFAEWRPWKYLSSGETVAYPVTINLPPPAQLLKGDDEMDSGDSSARINFSYSVRTDAEGTGLIVDVNVSAQEMNETCVHAKDTCLLLTHSLTYKQLVQNGFKIEVVDEGSKMTKDFRGKRWSSVDFPTFKNASAITVKYDSKGRSDHKNTTATLRLDLQFKVVGAVSAR